MRLSYSADDTVSTLSATEQDCEKLSEAVEKGLSSLSRTREFCFTAATPVAGEISRVWGARKNGVANIDAYVLQMITRVELALEDFERNEDDGLAKIKNITGALGEGESTS